MSEEYYTDIDSLFERWVIMTTNKQGDIATMRWCIAHCDPSIAEPFAQRIERTVYERNALGEYIEAGFWLVPCKEIEGRQILFKALYTYKEHTKIDPTMQAEDKETLKT